MRPLQHVAALSGVTTGYDTMSMQVTPVGNPFKKLRAEDFICQVWFERDRAHIHLETPDGRTVFDLWDESVFQAIEDGYLTPPRRPRPSSAEWQPAAVQYAVDTGLLSL